MAKTTKKNMTDNQLKNIEGHKFKKGVSGNPKGRPKNRILAQLNELLPKSKLEEYKVKLSPSEIDTIETKALQLDFPTLQLLAQDKKTCAYLKSIAVAIIIDFKNGRTTTVDRLRDRQYGSTKQNLEVSSTVEFTNMLMKTGMLEDIEDDAEESEDDEDDDDYDDD